jgi:hypothetical protein
MMVRITRYFSQSGHISVPFSLDNRESKLLWGKVVKSHWIEKVIKLHRHFLMSSVEYLNTIFCIE